MESQREQRIQALVRLLTIIYAAQQRQRQREARHAA